VLDTLPLLDLPEPSLLRLVSSAGQTVVFFGDKVLFCYAGDDIGMRNMAVVALTDAGVRGKDVAEVFGVTAEYVSILRGRARTNGSAGLVRRRGRPPKLGARQVATARRWAAEGLTQTEIARRLSVSRPVIGELLSRLGPAPLQPALIDSPAGAGIDVEASATDPAPMPEDVVPEDVVPEDVVPEDVVRAADPVAVSQGPDPQDAGSPVVGGARIGQGTFTSRYAGAMLLHPFLDRVGAAGVLSGACGRFSRRYDDLGVLTATCLAFALGTSSVEASKHLVRGQVGPAAGIWALPELRTLRPRLAELADAADPLQLQRRLATAMLAADAPELGLYFVDDHFVPYSGAKPVPKGYNTKRRHAQRGRDDTLVTDYHGRAVCFASGDPTGLSVTLPGALAQLREVLGADAKIMLGFDRGGSYPSVFRACRAAGADWLTWRRGALAAVTAPPMRSFRVGPSGICETITLADEMVEIDGYGPARQLTLFEHDQPVLQVLTSDTTAPAAALLAWLRCRWRIENAFKYLTAHHGIDWLCDYHADINPDTTMITNPARLAARKQLATAEAELADAERALAQLLGSDQHHTTINAAIPTAQARITTARDTVAHAKTERDAHPAKLPANVIDPDAKRARLRTHRRALQMTLRLLAYNAEHWLATQYNTYLQDPDEYRAITRNLLHLGGTITYTTNTITVTLDRPPTPRLTHTLRLLLDEINTTPPRLPGDTRPITYRLTQT
jgi:transposase